MRCNQQRHPCHSEGLTIDSWLDILFKVSRPLNDPLHLMALLYVHFYLMFISRPFEPLKWSILEMLLAAF